MNPQLFNQYQRIQTRFITDLNRAKTLYNRLVEHGGTDETGQWRNLRITDKRDIAQFLFFECASQWENFAKLSLTLAIRDTYNISAQKADFVLGNPDQGLNRIMGWGDPKIFKDRSKHYLGVNSTIARLNAIPGHGQYYYNLLSWSHKIRNRIAHTGNNQSYNNILAALKVPANQRKGVGPARLLTDYPNSQPRTNRWFHQLILNYENVANHLLKNL